MKLSSLIVASALYATSSAWSVTFVADNGHKRVEKGGRTNITCSNISWDGVNARDIKYIDFKAATKHRPDPTELTVYPDLDCGGNATSFKKGVHKPGAGLLVASFKVGN